MATVIRHMAPCCFQIMTYYWKWKSHIWCQSDQ